MSDHYEARLRALRVDDDRQIAIGTVEERDALADAIAALRKISSSEELVNAGLPTELWAVHALNHLQEIAREALARLDRETV